MALPLHPGSAAPVSSRLRLPCVGTKTIIPTLPWRSQRSNGGPNSIFEGHKTKEFSNALQLHSIISILSWYLWYHLDTIPLQYNIVIYLIFCEFLIWFFSANKKSERTDQLRISGGWPECCLAISKYSSASGFLHGTFFENRLTFFQNEKKGASIGIWKQNSWFILRFISGYYLSLSASIIWFIYMFIYVSLVISGSTIWFNDLVETNRPNYRVRASSKSPGSLYQLLAQARFNKSRLPWTMEHLNLVPYGSKYLLRKCLGYNLL